MRKLLFLLFFTTSFFTSCSDDSGSGETEELKVISKLTYTDFESGVPQVRVSDFVYDGANLMSYTNGSKTTAFEYDGEKVLVQRHYTDGILQYSYTFLYDGDVLVGNQGDHGYRTEISYDGTDAMTFESMYFDEDVWTTNYLLHFELLNGNAVEKTEIMTGAIDTYKRIEYEYDTHVNPMRDMNRYLRQIFTFEGIIGLSANNYTLSRTFYSLTDTVPTTAIHEITYDDEGFPVLIKKIGGSGLIGQTAIEYITISVPAN